MDLETIKNRLDSLTNKSKREKVDYNKIFFKPTIGKQVIRVVPSKFNPKNPFTELSFHYGIGKYPMVSPTNFGDKDPIMEFAKQLRQSEDPEDWQLAKKLTPKTRIFLPVIERGKENEGVKLFQFGKQLYEEFLQMAVDEEIGDYSDVSSGRDIKLNTVGPEATGTKYNRTTISPSLKESVLTDDQNLLNTLLEEQPNPKDLYQVKSYEDMKKALQEWIDPSDEDEVEESNESEEETLESEVEDFLEKKPTPSTPKVNKKVKQTPQNKFEDLFDDED